MEKPVVRISKVYTKGGDKGQTSLVGGGRVDKDHPRVEAYGTIDELNSVLGLVRYHNRQTSSCAQKDRFDAILHVLQNWLFDLGSELATDPESPRKRKGLAVKESYVEWLEAVVDAMNEELKPLPSFTLPGGGIVAAHLHQARTVCRRAERRIITLSKESELGPWAAPFVNRLSDALFVFSRWVVGWNGEEELLWGPETPAPEDWSWK